MSLLSSFCSGISSALSSACSAIGSFVSKAISPALKFVGAKAGGFIGLIAGLPAGPLGPILGPIIGDLVFKVVVKGIEFIAKKLGLIQEKDKAEELGYRLEEATEHDDWKKPDEFASMHDYYEYLKQQIPNEAIDTMKLQENRMPYMAIGTAALTKAWGDQINMDLPESFLFEAGKNRLTPDEMRACVEAFQNLGYGRVELSDFLKGKVSPTENRDITEALVSAMYKYCPDKTDDDIRLRISSMKDISRNDNMLKVVYKKELAEVEKVGKNSDVER